MNIANYEKLPLASKKLIVDLVDALLYKHSQTYRGTQEVCGEVILLGCCFKGWNEVVATEVIRMQAELHNIKVA